MDKRKNADDGMRMQYSIGARDSKKGINRIGWAFLSIQFAIPKRSKGECGWLRDNGNTRDQ